MDPEVGRRSLVWKICCPPGAPVEADMAEYRIYTLDKARRIVRCREASCSDDRQAFIISATLGETDAELEIWQGERFVGCSTHRPASGNTPHRLLTTTVSPRSAGSRVAPGLHDLSLADPHE